MYNSSQIQLHKAMSFIYVFWETIRKIETDFLRFFNNLSIFKNPYIGPSVPLLPAMVIVHDDSFFPRLVIDFSILQNT